MAFDAPGSSTQVEPLLIVYGFLIYPVMYLFSISCAWIYAKNNPKASLILSLIPLINILVIAFGILIW
jgi:hypothetical protein